MKLGPFSFRGSEWLCSSLRRKLNNHNRSEEHPSIQRDGLVFVSRSGILNGEDREYFCGFDSLEKLNVWFDDITEITKYGFVISVYEVPDLYVKIGRSGKQLMFKMSEATHLENLK